MCKVGENPSDWAATASLALGESHSPTFGFGIPSLALFHPLLLSDGAPALRWGRVEVADAYSQPAAVVHQEPRELWLPAEDIVSREAHSSAVGPPLPSGCPAEKHDPTSSLIDDDCSTLLLKNCQHRPNSYATLLPGRARTLRPSPVSVTPNLPVTSPCTTALWHMAIVVPRQMGETLLCDRRARPLQVGITRSETLNSRVKHSDCFSA